MNTNVLKDIPYADDKMGKRKVVDTDDILIMQIALKPGQAVPDHNANSNVHLLIIEGTITANLDGTENTLEKGSLTPVAYKTPMQIKNKTDTPATFLVLKTPNPAKMS
ncbi:hypothetical protein STSP2_00854 [Anaerohalosphaera lusitana]|uniref:Cupin domain protein n=1 Tax=Anaerohalosphaera lusitana TaxID=1936003 RepID=A0A1U9NJM3_9BACT|nr:cupin domain-containing protein [Anaerohalosphaera lusitana]AQT67706.1 hypothetical protein STSP2_00854 [Anaerohalosphaera lusitana]